MPHNPIPGLDHSAEANPNSTLQQTTHGDHSPTNGHRPGMTGTSRGRHAADSQSMREHDAVDPAQQTSGRRSGANSGSVDQSRLPWYSDDRIGLAVAVLLLAGVFVAAWAVHRDD